MRMPIGKPQKCSCESHSQTMNYRSVVTNWLRQLMNDPIIEHTEALNTKISQDDT